MQLIHIHQINSISYNNKNVSYFVNPYFKKNLLGDLAYTFLTYCLVLHMRTTSQRLASFLVNCFNFFQIYHLHLDMIKMEIEDVELGCRYTVNSRF